MIAVSEDLTDRNYKVTVLGLGNILLGDEGAGVRAVEQLQAKYVIPEDVEVVDGGTAGIDLLPHIRKETALIILDAIKPDKGPGTILRLQGAEVPAFLSAKLSPHQIGLPDLLATADLLDRTPSRLVMYGIEPKSIATGTDLSSEIAGKLDELLELVVRELKEIGITLQKLSAALSP